MNENIFKQIEIREDEILEKLDKLTDEIKNNIRITTGVSSEFKESLNDKLIETLYIMKNTITWDRELLK